MVQSDSERFDMLITSDDSDLPSFWNDLRDD